MQSNELGAKGRIRVGGFVVRQTSDGLEVLLMRRYKPERGVYFVIPGGSLEHFETLEEGARRELREETNLEFELDIKLYESCNPFSRRMAHYFVAQYLGGEPCLTATAPESVLQHQDNDYCPTWVRLEQVAQLALFPSIIRSRLATDLRQGAGNVIRLIETD